MKAALAPRSNRGAPNLLGAERAYKARQYKRCAELAGRVLKGQPNHPQALKLQALCASAAGDDASAVEWLQRLLKVCPGDGTSQMNVARLLMQQGRFVDALNLLCKIEDQPDAVTPSSELLQAECLACLGRESEAIALFNSLVERCPHSPEVYYSFVSLLHKLGRWNTALELLEIGLAFLPGAHGLLHRKALLLSQRGMHGTALEIFSRLEDSPGYTLACELDHANVLSAFRDFDRAFKKYQAILDRQPDHRHALVSFARTLCASSRYVDAVAQLKLALEKFPDDVEMLFLLAVASFAKLDFQAAKHYYGEVFKRSPNYPTVAGSYLYCSSFVCDWDHYEEIRAVIDCDSAHVASWAFPSILFDTEPALNLGYAKSYLGHEIKNPLLLGPIAKYERREKIRIGYFSSDFYAHATVMLLEGMLMAHDRSRFELHAFSLNPTPPDDRHKRVRGHFDHFHEVSGISDSAVALLSREHEIDIAIDLKGFTMGARPGIFAERAAPIQINYLGFPGSMGASFIDYMVADHYTVTPGNRPFFSEKIIYLPHCYQPNSPHRPKPVSDSPRPSELPAGAFVYCSFNNVYKLTPTQFDLWIRVLKQTPGSVLWLLKSTEQAQINLTKRAADAGLDPQRIIFAPLVPEAEHLQRVSFADCFLDSFPCNAHTTASDAVWAGVPLITRSGKTFASRVAGSILTTIGLPELIVEDDAAYEALALRVYNDSVYLANLKRRVKEGVQNGPLYNAELYTRHFEQALSAVYEAHHKGAAPDHLAVSG